MATSQRAKRAATPANRYDIGALEQRVFGTEKAIGDLRQDMSMQIGSLQNNLVQVAKDLGEKIDGQVREAAKSQRTDWNIIFIAGGVVISLAVAIGGMALTPLDRDIDRVDANTRAIAGSYVSREDLRDILGYAEKRFDHLDDQVDKLRNDAITKDDERDYRASMSDQVKTLYQQLDALRDRVATPGK